jgi:hypothetical protein
LRLVGSTTVTAVLLGLIGCATVPPAAEMAATTSSFTYTAGRGSQAFAAPPAVVIAALHDAMADLSMTLLSSTRDGAVHRVVARTADNRQVVATLRWHQVVTAVAVRVGWFGDEPLSQAILERVGVRLGSREPEAIPSTAPSTPSRNPFFTRDAVPDSVMLRDFAEAPYRDRVIP